MYDQDHTVVVRSKARILIAPTLVSWVQITPEALMFLFCVVLASTGIGPATGRYYVKGVRPNVKKSLENLLEKFSESKGPDLMAVYTRTYDLFI